MKTSSHLLALFLALAAVLPCAAQSVAEQQDALVIESLRSAGSNLAKPHNIDFFFYFPRQSQAEAASAEIASLGYNVVAVERIPGQAQWHVQATRLMVPKLETMTASTRSLEGLVAKHGGDYDGWGTGIVD